jgi:hypothetical protein
VARQHQAWENFNGGWSTNDPEKLNANELEIGDNIEIDERGGAVIRWGTSKVNPDSFAAQVEQLIEWPRKDGTITSLAVIGTSLYKINSDGTRTLIQALAASKIGYYFLQDCLYFGDGSKYYRYTGSACAEVQLAGAPVAPTVTGAGSGSWDGSYKYKIVYVDAYEVESAASDAASVTISDKASIEITNIPTGPAGTVKVRIYRTTDGSDWYKYLAEVSNGTASYTDTIHDEDLGSDTLPENLDLTAIKRCKHFWRHSKSFRIFAAGDPQYPEALYWMEPNQPGKHKETSVLFPVTGEGPILGLYEFMDALIVAYKKGFWVWRGIDPDVDVRWEKLPVKDGSQSPWAMELGENCLLAVGAGALYRFNPSILGMPNALTPGEGLVQNLAEMRVDTVISGCTAPSVMAGSFDTKRHKYYLAYADTGARNNKILVWDQAKNCFTRWTGIAANDVLVRSDGVIWFACENYILKLDPASGHDILPDGTSAGIAFDLKTPETSFGLKFFNKIAHRVYVSLKNPFLADYQLRVRLYVDDAVVHDETYTPDEAVKVLLEPTFKVHSKGLRIGIRFTCNQADTPTTIYGVGLDYTVVRNSYGVKV